VQWEDQKIPWLQGLYKAVEGRGLVDIQDRKGWKMGKILRRRRRINPIVFPIFVGAMVGFLKL
jgi:hypothetical protein